MRSIASVAFSSRFFMAVLQCLISRVTSLYVISIPSSVVCVVGADIELLMRYLTKPNWCTQKLNGDATLELKFFSASHLTALQKPWISRRTTTASAVHIPEQVAIKLLNRD